MLDCLEVAVVLGEVLLAEDLDCKLLFGVIYAVAEVNPGRLTFTQARFENVLAIEYWVVWIHRCRWPTLPIE